MGSFKARILYEKLFKLALMFQRWKWDRKSISHTDISWEKIFYLCKDLNLRPSDSFLLAWTRPSFQGFASLQSISLHLFVAGTLVELRAVTKTTHMAARSIIQSLYIKWSMCAAASLADLNTTTCVVLCFFPQNKTIFEILRSSIAWDSSFDIGMRPLFLKWKFLTMVTACSE